RNQDMLARNRKFADSPLEGNCVDALRGSRAFWLGTVVPVAGLCPASHEGVAFKLFFHVGSFKRERGGAVRFSSVDAPFQAREIVGIVAARGRMLSSVRPLMRQEDSRRPVWEFADRVQITRSVLEAQWKALVVPAPSRRLLRHTLLPLTLTSSRPWSAYA